jgi:iron complex transport system substrate-binding protein
MSTTAIIKRHFIITLLFVFAGLISFIRPSQGADTRIITDLDGEKIVIPDDPKRIVCLWHPAYDKIIMMSSPSRIAMIPNDATQWASKFFPELKGIPRSNSGQLPDLERMLKLNPDLVIYQKGHINISKVVDAGIPAICPYTNNVVPTSIEEYMAEFKRELIFLSEVLGPDAKVRAEKYCKYLDSINARVMTITSRIPEANKPRVYYGKMSDVFSTQGSNTIMRWYTELSGGIYLPKELDTYFATVNMEKIMSWDPDIILLGMNRFSSSGNTDEKLKNLRAYTSGKVYNIPVGMFYWDMTSCETALLPLYLGKKFHPDLFKDWDIIKEMKAFYSEIYRINVTDEDAERVLKAMPPLN